MACPWIWTAVKWRLIDGKEIVKAQYGQLGFKKDRSLIDEAAVKVDMDALTTGRSSKTIIWMVTVRVQVQTLVDVE